MTTSLPPARVEAAVPRSVCTGLGNTTLSRYQSMRLEPEEQEFMKVKTTRTQRRDAADPIMMTPWMTYVERRPIDSNDDEMQPTLRNPEFGPRDEYIGNEYADYVQSGTIVQSFLVPDTRCQLYDLPVTVDSRQAL